MKISKKFLIKPPLNRLNDTFFKAVLGSPERKQITIDFLNAVLAHVHIEGEAPIVIEDIEFIDRETIPESELSKGMRFDVLARSTDGRIFHIEVQNAKEPFFMKRSFFYAASDYVFQLQHGQSYNTLEPVIFIGIMNFTLIGSRDNPENWYSLHRLTDVETKKTSFRDVEFHMIEMPLLKRYLGQTNPQPKDKLEELLCYFGNIGGEKFMEVLAERNPTVDRLKIFEDFFAQDPIAIRNYVINERAKADIKYIREYDRQEARAEGLAEGRAEGIAKGLAEGRAKGRAEGIAEGVAEGVAETQKKAALNLRSQGILTIEQIAQALNMPVEAVAAL